VTVSRHHVFVEQTVGGKTYRQKSVAYVINDNYSLMNQLMRMDNALYRKSGAILPGRVWWVEEMEL
jgi:hypothetical protein